MKYLKRLLMLLVILIVPMVNAAGANISVSASSSQAIVGNKITVYVTISSSAALGSYEYTLNYNSSLFKFISSDVGLHYAGVVNNNKTKSVTYKYTFSAIKSGSGTFNVDSYAVTNWDGDYISVSRSGKTVKNITYDEYRASLSNNNNLKSLTVDGYEITPVFNKDTLEYSVIVSEKEKEITINAAKEDANATVTGDGKFEVSSGSNKFNIVVVAQNGSEKTYKLNVEVKDQNPIVVSIDDEVYNVVKLETNLVKPDSYTNTTIMINEFEIPAFYSEITEFTLVGLKNSDSVIELYIYDDGKYTKYSEFNFGNLTVYPLELNKEFNGYTKINTIINGVNIDVYKLNNESRFAIFHGLNVETGEDTYYLYDNKDNSLVKYDDENINILENKIKQLEYLTFGFAATTFIALICVIAISRRKHKKSNKIVNKKNVDNTDEKKDNTKKVSTKKENNKKKEMDKK